MGKLVLTRRAGESVQLTEPNGIVWLVTLDRNSPFFHKAVLRLQNGKAFTKHELWYGNSMTFAGGTVELRPHKRPDQAILAFDFPRDVSIVRTEIA